LRLGTAVAPNRIDRTGKIDAVSGGAQLGSGDRMSGSDVVWGFVTLAVLAFMAWITP
jgi:hypothetical protein